jgi:hypothetical protein
VVTANEIPPGGEGKIKVTVSTAGRPGKLHKKVSVYSNDPETPRFTLDVSGTVEMIAGFEPRFLALGKVKQGERVTRTVKLAGREAARLRLSQLTTSAPDRLKVRMTRADGAPALRVDFRSKEEGPFHGSITAQTNLEQPKQLRMTVRARVVGDLVVDRRLVFFPPFDVASPPTVELGIKSTSGRLFRIKRITDPAGVVQGKATRQGKDWQVALTLAKPPISRSGEIVLLTNRRDQPQLKLRYAVRATKPKPAPAAAAARRPVN